MTLLINKFNDIDAETKVILNGVPFLNPGEQIAAERYALERIQAFRAGLAKVPCHVNPYIQRETGDRLLQLRWDFDLDTWILERWQEEGYWLQVMVPTNLYGQTPKLNDQFLKNLVELLKANDLTRVNPAEYIRSKRRAADKVKEENRKHGDNMLCAAIDAMSTKQINNFIDVHRAIHTGERIVAHGTDLKSIEHMKAASDLHAHEVPVNKAFNQGMHPKIYQRNRRQR